MCYNFKCQNFQVSMSLSCRTQELWVSVSMLPENSRRKESIVRLSTSDQSGHWMKKPSTSLWWRPTTSSLSRGDGCSSELVLKSLLRLPRVKFVTRFFTHFLISFLTYFSFFWLFILLCSISTLQVLHSTTLTLPWFALLWQMFRCRTPRPSRPMPIHRSSTSQTPSGNSSRRLLQDLLGLENLTAKNWQNSKHLKFLWLLNKPVQGMVEIT